MTELIWEGEYVDGIRGKLPALSGIHALATRRQWSVDVDLINPLRASGHSWRTIAGMTGLSVGKACAAARRQGTEHAKVLCA
jgi:hypothetical protein